jgi:hypothetical protein
MKGLELASLIGLLSGLALIAGGLETLWDMAILLSQGWPRCFTWWLELARACEWWIVFDVGGIMTALGVFLAALGAYGLGYTRE